MKIILSFFAAIDGWLTGFCYYYILSLISYGRVTDIRAMLLGPGIFIFAWWLVMVVPAVIFGHKNIMESNMLCFLTVSSLYGLIGFFVLVGSWNPYFNKYPQIYWGYAMVTGLTAGLSYRLIYKMLDKSRQTKETIL